MKEFNPIQRLSVMLVGLLIGGFQLSASAGLFTWSSPTTITTADATLNQSGTVVGAEVFGSSEQIVSLSNNTSIDFKTDGSVASATGQGTTLGANTNKTGNANFNQVLTQFNYDGGPKTITLNNLTPGVQYSVQLFALDDRGGGARPANFQDPNDATDISANFNMSDNAYVVGTFTANASSMTIQENLLVNGGGNINALVMRQLTGLPLGAQIISQPQPTTVYHGQTAQLIVAAYGTALTYQWQKSAVGGSVFTNLLNAGSISGATNVVLTITNLTANDMGDYQVIVSNSLGSVLSAPPVTLTVLAGTPVYTWSAPAGITTADATLTQAGVVVGAEVFGTAEKVVTLTNGQLIDFKADGSVASVTAGGFGTAAGAFAGTSGNVNFDSVLTQFNYDGGPKQVTLNNLVVGQQYTVQLFALDDRGGGSSAVRANYQDANDPYDVSATLAMGDNVFVIGTFTATSPSMNIQENLIDNGGGGNINALVIRALGAAIAPQISTQPQGETLDQGLNKTFTVAATGSTPITYRWQRGTVGSGTFSNVPNDIRIVGQTNSTLIITNLVVSDTADYRVIVANAFGSVTSTPPATLSVLAVTPQFLWSIPTAITTADATLNQNGSIVGAAVFGPTPKIVVLNNGNSIDFKNDSSMATATGQGTTTGAFSGNTSNANFNAVLNEFNYDNGPKTITLNNLVAGQQYAVQLFALDDRNGTGTRNANFQDPADPSDYSATFFMPDNVFIIATFTASASSVSLQENLFNNGGGNINALVVRQLSSLPLVPQITTQPQSATLPFGVSVQLTVGATGTPLTYQWQRAAVGSGVFSNVSDGNASGSTTAQLTITNLAGVNTADYRVIVSNGAGSVTSSPPATLTVITTPVTLTHRWSFSELSGTIAHDSIGSADGTLQGNANFNAGYVVLPNSGSGSDNSYVSIPGGLLNSYPSVTVEAWVTNNGWANGNTFVGFGGQWDSTGTGTNFIDFFSRWFNAISSFQIQTTAGDSGIVNLGTRVNYNAISSTPSPAHYAYTYDPNTGNVALYTNGVLSGTAGGVNIPLSTLGTAVGTIGLAVWNTNFAAAIAGTSGNRPFMNAGVSEVRIYSGVLSSNAIADAFVLGPDQIPTSPQITSQPQSVSAQPGATVQFTAAATGLPLNYQWQRAPVGTSAFVNVTDSNASGATTAQLTVTNAGTSNVADYRLVVNNGSGVATSSTVTLVLSTKPTLLHRWSFSEASGIVAHDSVGGADGTLQGGANFNAGYAVLPNSGSAADSSYVSIPGGLLNNLQNVTIECWVTNNGWANGNTFVGFGGQTTASGSGTNFIDFFARWFNAISAFQIQTTAGDSGIVNLGARVNYNSISSPPSPAHYAYTYDPISGNVALYTNGVLSGTASGVTIPLSTLGTSIGTIGLATWNTNFAAAIPGTSGNRPFMNAGVSEVRIYSGVMSSNAIASEFQLGPDTLLSHTSPPLTVSSAAGTLTLSWPIANGGFALETSPVLGQGAVWTPVNATQSVVGANYQVTLSTTNGTAFYRLRE